jgi:hypothetical protein
MEFPRNCLAIKPLSELNLLAMTCMGQARTGKEFVLPVPWTGVNFLIFQALRLIVRCFLVMSLSCLSICLLMKTHKMKNKYIKNSVTNS